MRMSRQVVPIKNPTEGHVCAREVGALLRLRRITFTPAIKGRPMSTNFGVSSSTRVCTIPLRTREAIEQEIQRRIEAERARLEASIGPSSRARISSDPSNVRLRPPSATASRSCSAA